MVDESGLELSLGLSWDRSSRKSKVKGLTLDPKHKEGNVGRPIGSNMPASDDSFKYFPKADLDNHDLKGKQKSDTAEYIQENFFTDLSRFSSPKTDCFNSALSKPQLTRYQELWISSNRTTETEENKSTSSKRKVPFDETKFQNKYEKMTDFSNRHGNNFTEAPFMGNSHASVAIKEGIADEIDEAMKSAVGGSESWLALQREEKAEYPDKFNFSSQSKKELCLSGDTPNPNFGKIAFGIPMFPYPNPNMVPSTSSGPNPTNFSSLSTAKLMPPANGEPHVGLTDINKAHLTFIHPTVHHSVHPSVHPSTADNGSWSSFNPHASFFTGTKQSAGAKNQEHSEDVVKTSKGQLF